MSNEMWLRIIMLVIVGVIIYNIFAKPLYEVKISMLIGTIAFAVLWLLSKNIEGSLMLAMIIIFLSFIIDLDGDNIVEDHVETIVYKEKKKTWSEKRAEKKAKEEAYWQYVSDVEDEAASYED